MNDKELLELAGKAAAIKGEWSRWHQSYGDLWVEGLNIGGPILWNPLTDDGDALRLAVKLRIGVLINHYFEGEYFVKCGSWGSNAAFMEKLNPDSGVATRRAIVRAAAEIGRAMK